MIIYLQESSYKIHSLFKQQASNLKMYEKQQTEQGNRIQEYQQRLDNLPKVSEQMLAEIAKYQSLIDDQDNQLGIQDIKIKALESQLVKYSKFLQKIENQIQQLSSTEQKNANKEKRYLMQIQTYNKKIDTNKQNISKIQKSLIVLKKQIKTLESTINGAKSEKNKSQQILTKEQQKINSLTQTLNDLKLKIMSQNQPNLLNNDNQNKTKNDPTVLTNQIKRDQKQIQELFNAIKKQIALIDILKRQKVHLIASTVFKHCQEEFQNCLEMNKQK